jgi:hypothetical protein
MDEAGFLRDLAAVFGCAAVVDYRFHLLKQSPIVGFAITGAMILGIIRESNALNNPESSEQIFSGDRLVLSGIKEQLNQAIQMRTRGKT